jgi:hypothetical protein
MLKQLLRQILYPCAALIAACATTVPSANAADITYDDRFYSVQLEGQIVSGDYEKLRSVAEDLGLNIRDNPHQAFPVVLHLFSPGGDLAEAIKIGRLVRALRWWTSTPEKSSYPSYRKQKLKEPETNFMCASACFFIFVAGIDRYGGYRTYVAPLILGIHRPYLSEKDLRAMSSKDAMTSVTNMMTSVTNIRTAVENYMKEMSVPTKYADLMFFIPRDSIQWLTTADVSELRGFIPELRDWVDAKCDTRTEIEKTLSQSIEAKLKRGEMSDDDERILDMLHAKDEQRGDCEQKVRIELDKQGIKEVFK